MYKKNEAIKMLNIQSLIAIIEVVLVVVPALLTVAFVTIAERKTMASMQRRLGPNIVGYYGLLQAFADALKLLLKEYVGPTQFNFIFSWSNNNFNIFIIRLCSNTLWSRSCYCRFKSRYIIHVSCFFFSYIWYIIGRLIS